MTRILLPSLLLPLLACGGSWSSEPEPATPPTPEAPAPAMADAGTAEPPEEAPESPGTMAALVPEEPAVAAASEGALTKDDIARVIRQHADRFRRCYSYELTKMPGLEGKVSIGFTIGSDGTVTEAHATGMEPPSLRRCLEAAMKEMVFPAPKGGGTVSVSYPFIFKIDE